MAFPVRLRQPHRVVGEVAGPSHEDVGVVEQLHGLDVVVDRAVVEEQVEIADPGVVRLALEEPHLAVRVLLAEPAQQRRQDLGRHALEGPDVDAARTGLQPLDGLAQPLGVAEQSAAALEDQLPQDRQPHRPGPARAIEDRATDGPLQCRDLLAHRRLGVGQPTGRPAERPLVGDGDEGPQVSQVEVHPVSISQGDQRIENDRFSGCSPLLSVVDMTTLMRSPRTQPPSDAMSGPRPALLVAALLTVYVAWGSTYLAVRVMVDDMPTLLGTGTRALAAGVLLAAGLAAWSGPQRLRLPRSRMGCAVVGLLLPVGGQGLVAVPRTAGRRRA